VALLLYGSSLGLVVTLATATDHFHLRDDGVGHLPRYLSEVRPKCPIRRATRPRKFWLGLSARPRRCLEIHPVFLRYVPAQIRRICHAVSLGSLRSTN
jgi:hypothetical protein